MPNKIGKGLAPTSGMARGGSQGRIGLVHNGAAAKRGVPSPAGSQRGIGMFPPRKADLSSTTPVSESAYERDRVRNLLKLASLLRGLGIR